MNVRAPWSVIRATVIAEHADASVVVDDGDFAGLDFDEPALTEENLAENDQNHGPDQDRGRAEFR